MQNITGKSKVLGTISTEMVALPRKGLSLNEAMDKCLAAHPGNHIYDYGDRKGRELLVGKASDATVEYELVPELSPPGFTLDQMAAHMKAAGFDVRGVNRQKKTVIVCEAVSKGVAQ